MDDGPFAQNQSCNNPLKTGNPKLDTRNPEIETRNDIAAVPCVPEYNTRLGTLSRMTAAGMAWICLWDRVGGRFMAFCELRYFSQALQKANAANVILPETDTSGPFPVFYLLHGLSDDHTMWQRRTSIERYVRDLPLIVVMPDGGRGFYCDAEAGMAWETAIIQDLVSLVDKMFPTIKKRSGRCVGGLSMGGYGAVKFALKYPEMFCSANSHSGALYFGHTALSADPADRFAVEFTRVIGPKPTGGPNDLFALAESVDAQLRPALLIDCGAEDFLLDANRACHAHLEKIGYPHEYREFPGSHDWAYWDVHIQEALQFHLRSLTVPRARSKGSR